MKHIFPFLLLILSLPLAGQDKKELTLEDIWLKGTFSSKSVPGFTVLNDGETYVKLDMDQAKGIMEINRYSIRDGSKTGLLVSNENLKNEKGERLDISGFTLSADENKVLFETEAEQIYRHSYSAYFHVLDLKSGKLYSGKDRVRYATLSPDAAKIAYVKENDLYFTDIGTGKESRVTSDGKVNHIINGAVDWVYEEEFSMSRGFEWDPTSTYIAYYRFDESAVKQFSMDLFTGLYPEQEVWKYPKAGEANSVVNVYIYDAGKNKSVLCKTGENKDIYLPRIKWTAEDGVLSIQRLNRLQNHWEILFANAADGKTRVVYEEKNKYYIDITDNLEFRPNGSSFVFTSEMGGYNHAWEYNYKSKLLKQISQGNWDIDQFLGMDEKTGRVYFTSAANGPMNRDFRWASTEGEQFAYPLEASGWHYIVIAKGFRYFVDYFSTMSKASLITLYKMEGEKVKVLEDNKALNEKLDSYNLAPVTFQSFNVSGVSLSGWVMKPEKTEAGKKYPVLMYVYGGPGSQTVTNRWSGSYYLWFQYLVSKGYIVVSVDNRGTGFKGEEFKKMTYLQMGKYETEDQIAVAKYLGTLDYIDKNRIGIFGWSFGGYMSSLCISKGAGVFNTAVAVAPVSNWRYYDNIYTERFMRTPQENGKNYDENSPINFVDRINGNYLIIHGTADDNVHFQNAVEMVEEMIRKNVRYDAEFYPNKNHSIGGGNTRLHLFTRISRYLMEKL